MTPADTDAAPKPQRKRAPRKGVPTTQADQAPAPAAPPTGELVVMDAKQRALALVAPHRAALDKFRQKYGPDVIVQYDLTTPQGNAAARADRLELVTLRTTADRERKKATEDARRYVEVVNETVKALIDEAAPYENAVDTVIKADERRRAEEKERVEREKREREAAIATRLNDMRNMVVDAALGKTADEMDAMAMALRSQELTEADFGTRFGEAVSAKDHVIGKLEAMAAEKRHNEKLRQENEERQRRIAEEEAAAVERRRQAEKEERERLDRQAAELRRQEEELAERRRALEAQERQAREAREAQETAAREAREAEERAARELLQQRRTAIDDGIRGLYEDALQANTVEACDRALVYAGETKPSPDFFGPMLGEAVLALDETTAKVQALRAQLVRRDEEAAATAAAAEERRRADEEAAAARRQADAEAAAERQRQADREAAERRLQEARDAAEAERTRKLAAYARSGFDALLLVFNDGKFDHLSLTAKQAVANYLNAVDSTINPPTTTTASAA